MNKKKLISSLAILFLSFSCVLNAEENLSPLKLVKETVDQVLVILKNPDFKDPEKQEKLKEDIFNLVNERFSWLDMSKRSLGQLWKEQTVENQDKYVKLYTQILRKTYVDKISGGGNEIIEYEAENIKGEYAEVKTKIIQENSTEIPLYYRMLNRDNKWLVYDVVIEGVSLIKNYRSQFEEILDKSSFSEFLDKLESKIAKD